MKRYIKAATEYGETYHFSHGNKRFLAQYNDDDHMVRNGQVRSIHPYDDAEYTWAKIEGPVVKFIRNGKVLDKMTMADYDEDWWDDGYGNDNAYSAYLSDYFDIIAVELLQFDRNVKPIMVHN